MENFDVNAVKELYTELKIKNYEKEKELRTLIKLKEKFPPAAKEEKWINKYRSLMSSIAEEIECFKKLKTVLSKEEMELLAYDVQCDIFKKIYYANNLDRFELQKEDIPAEQYNIENTGYIYNNLEPQIENEAYFEKNKFAQMILGEKNFLKKIDLVAYLAQKDRNFFDTSVIYKGEMARLFVNKMKLEGIDENEVITAALMYSCKKIDSAQEIERLKKEKTKDFDYLKSLGFSDRFCKMCVEHTRYNEPTENYTREPEGDILELIENYVGLTMHREDRMAFPIDEAMDLIEHKNLQGKNNRYLNTFKEFVEIMEGVKI